MLFVSSMWGIHEIRCNGKGSCIAVLEPWGVCLDQGYSYTSCFWVSAGADCSDVYCPQGD